MHRLGCQSRGRVPQPDGTEEDFLLGKFALTASACIVLLAAFAHGQQIDVAVGGGTLMSSSPASKTINFQPPPEKSGAYLNVSADFSRFKHRRLGLNLETAFRVRQANYDGFEKYRPILTDVNALFQPRLGKKIGLELLGGLGVATTRFNLAASCNIPGCINYTNSNHFMEHIGAGVRYSVRGHVFVRPEVHYYHIQNNVEFNSGNVFRVGVSIGYALHPE
jgi:opacity protein-like surface antigen